MEEPINQPVEPVNQQPSQLGRNGISWRNLLIGIFIGILIGIAGLLFYQENLPKITNALYTATWVLFGLVIITFLLFWGFKEYLTRSIFGSKIGGAADIIEDSQRASDIIIERVADRVFSDLPVEERGRIKFILPRLTNWFIWSRLRNWWWQWLLGLFVSLGGITGTILLMNQNELLQAQNEKIEKQTELATLQMSLEEASRRSTLIVLMSNILDKVDNEIEAQKKALGAGNLEDNKYSLSQSLIGQIAALSHSFKPYRFLDADTLIGKPLSPERGQLLFTLTRLPLDSSIFNEIYESSNFNKADLGGANLSGAYLCGASLMEANLSFANLGGANLGRANLNRADLYRANLNEAVLYGTDFSYAILDGIELREVNLNGAILRGVEFRWVDLENVDLSNSNLSGADLSGLNLTETILRKADLSGADLSSANLSGVDLSYAKFGAIDISGESWHSIFLGTNIDSTNFTNANMTGVYFGDSWWPISMNQTNFSGANLKAAVLSIEQAANASSFYNCVNLHDSIRSALQKTHPQLFASPKHLED